MSRWSALAAEISFRSAGGLVDGRPLCLRCLGGAGGLGAGEAARLLTADRLRWLSVPAARAAGSTDCHRCAGPLLLVG